MSFFHNYKKTSYRKYFKNVSHVQSDVSVSRVKFKVRLNCLQLALPYVFASSFYPALMHIYTCPSWFQEAERFGVSQSNFCIFYTIKNQRWKMFSKLNSSYPEFKIQTVETMKQFEMAEKKIVLMKKRKSRACNFSPGLRNRV